MVIRVYTLSGTVPAGASNYEVDKKVTITGVTRTLQEVRFYCSLPDDTFIQLMLGTDPIYNFEAKVNDVYKLPYPGNLLWPAGGELRLVCTNRNSTTASTVKVEVIVEEAKA
jgi:hypothetical protein